MFEKLFGKQFPQFFKIFWCHYVDFLRLGVDDFLAQAYTDSHFETDSLVIEYLK